jgi:Fringe-like
MKLFALVVTTARFWENRSMACVDTWLPDFDDYLFCTDANSGPKCAVVTNRADYDSCKIKQVEGLLVCEREHGDFDWYFTCGDDTCVNAKNLRKLCESLLVDHIAQYGQVQNCFENDKSLHYISGGGGHLMNRKTLTAFNQAMQSCGESSNMADVAFGQCARKAKIPQEHCDLFHSQPIFEWDESTRVSVKGAVSYHYIQPEKMKHVYDMMTLP